MNKNLMIATVVASLMNIGLQAYEGLPASVTREQSMVAQPRLNQAPPSTTAQQEVNQAPPSTTSNMQQAVTQAPPSTTADMRQAATTNWQNSSTAQSIKQNVPQTGKTGKFGFF